MTTAEKKEMLDKTRRAVHPHCAVCDLANPKGLNIEYVLAKDGEEVKASFWCDKNYEGYPGVMHGGMITAIFDGAMGNCLFAYGKAAVTVEITTRFKHPVAIQQYATVSARITRFSYPLYLLEAEMSQDGIVKATAKGKFYDRPDLVDVLKQR